MNERKWSNRTRDLTLMLSLICISSFSINNVLASQYAGYKYFQNPGTPPGVGTSAVIYTLNANVPGSGTNFYCQWSCVILSASPLYWVQVGYVKGIHTGQLLRWYDEICDSANPYPGVRTYHGGPSVGSTHRYYLTRTTASSHTWTMGVSTLTPWSVQKTPSPWLQINYQAMSEMWASTINISGTHFTDLSYQNSPSDWVWWAQAYQLPPSPPYSSTWVSSHEFWASGGGG